jgi:hypothetical protein
VCDPLVYIKEHYVVVRTCTGKRGPKPRYGNKMLIGFTDEQVKLLKQLGRKRGKSRSALIREAVVSHFSSGVA